MVGQRAGYSREPGIEDGITYRLVEDAAFPVVILRCDLGQHLTGITFEYL